jgi:hypothetical protein
MRLEKFQRNGIFEALEAGGVNPHECDLSEDDSGARITHAPSRSYLTIGSSAPPWAGSYVVGNSALVYPYEAFAWTGVEEHVERWAEKVKRDVETPDRWAEIKREREMLTGARYEHVEDAPFTEDEQAELARLLGEILDYAEKNFALSEAQALALKAGFGEVSAASARSSRKHVRLVLLGVMLEVIAADLLPNGTVMNVLVTALHALDHLFGGGGAPPQLLPPV